MHSPVGTDRGVLKALAPALAEVGSKMVSLATVESNPDLATALRRLGKTWEAAGSIAQAQVWQFGLPRDVAD